MAGRESVKARVWRWVRVQLTRAARTPFIVVLVGVLIVGIPGFFTIVPEALDWPLSIRMLIAAILFVLAVAAVIGALGRDRAWDQLVSETERHRRQRRVRALQDVLGALLREKTRASQHRSYGRSTSTTTRTTVCSRTFPNAFTTTTIYACSPRATARRVRRGVTTEHGR
jgi:hypothetical protein